MKLKVRVVRYGCRGHEQWYADIDDADDRQPDDPYWYVDGCASQCEALEQACHQLIDMVHRATAGERLTRLSGAYPEAAASTQAA
jgi:NADH:ubiquinone oxidoreductase subunit B-like Fe-S oxidoreductase